MGAPTQAGVGASLVAAAQALAVDGVTAEAVAALRARGIRSVLLKGPVLAGWLYPDAPRPYVDADLLVAPADLERTRALLAERGFERDGPPRPSHAEPWLRPEDGAQVDLHRALSGVALGPAEAWDVVTGLTEPMTVAGVEVEAPVPVLRALIVACHAAQHGPDTPRPMADLARAVAMLPEPLWAEASALAARLDAIPAFATGLRLLPEGERLAERLELAPAALIELAVDSGSHARVALGMERLAARPGARAKLALLRRELLPSADFMRAWSRLARRGPLGLAAAYPWRLGWVIWHAGPSLLAWRRLRR